MSFQNEGNEVWRQSETKRRRDEPMDQVISSKEDIAGYNLLKR